MSLAKNLKLEGLRLDVDGYVSRRLASFRVKSTYSTFHIAHGNIIATTSSKPFQGAHMLKKSKSLPRTSGILSAPYHAALP